MALSLRGIDAKVLNGLDTLGGRDRAVGVADLAESLGLDQSPVSGSLTMLAEEGLIEISERIEVGFRVGPKSTEWTNGSSPERRVAEALAKIGGRASLKEIPERTGLEQRAVGQSLRWLVARGWAKNDRGELQLAEAWSAPSEREPHPDERFVARLVAAEGEISRAALEQEGIDVAEALRLLEGRSGVVQPVERRRRSARITDSGTLLIGRGIEAREEVTELTTELLVSGRWRDVSFRKYDVALPGTRQVAGKPHPFRRVLEGTRRAFLHMGFEETASPWVESAFWDFDALFQPQDHPARDMQDTFYTSRPDHCELPSEALVNRVRETHENGGTSGSTGWQYRWSSELAGQCVLRTHTTSATIRALANDPRPPRKVFCVGPVFRRETIDYKHLPVFHQVDGIVVDETASFATLLTLLETFYTKMGFEKIQFRPAFFPYTEPSVEVFVWMEGRNDWVEMGGAGVFRAEVTEPLGCEVPVLAWGLGLERLAMFRFGLGDIRELYLAHLRWLEEVRLCRF